MSSLSKQVDLTVHRVSSQRVSPTRKCPLHRGVGGARIRGLGRDSSRSEGARAVLRPAVGAPGVRLIHQEPDEWQIMRSVSGAGNPLPLAVLVRTREDDGVLHAHLVVVADLVLPDCDFEQRRLVAVELVGLVGLSPCPARCCRGRSLSVGEWVGDRAVGAPSLRSPPAMPPPPAAATQDSSEEKMRKLEKAPAGADESAPPASRQFRWNSIPAGWVPRTPARAGPHGK